jgi:hypothetical protein
VLKRALNNFNLHDRFDVYTASPRSVGDFNQKLAAFIQKIGALPPLESTVPARVAKKGGAKK